MIPIDSQHFSFCFHPYFASTLHSLECSPSLKHSSPCPELIKIEYYFLKACTFLDVGNCFVWWSSSNGSVHNFRISWPPKIPIHTHTHKVETNTSSKIMSCVKERLSVAWKQAKDWHSVLSGVGQEVEGFSWDHKGHTFHMTAKAIL